MSERMCVCGGCVCARACVCVCACVRVRACVRACACVYLVIMLNCFEVNMQCIKRRCPARNAIMNTVIDKAKHVLL